MNISLACKLFICMKKKTTNKKLSTFKKKKPLERKIADDLVRTHERNEKLRDKNINTSFLDLF
jgi:16S rRNA C1402 (ribose-2'-O) methylase RsmI